MGRRLLSEIFSSLSVASVLQLPLGFSLLCNTTGQGSWLAPDQRNLLKSLDQKNRAPYAD